MDKRGRQQSLNDGEKILICIEEIQIKLQIAKQSFAYVIDETLMDSYIYEIIALTKKYEYFLREAKGMGLTFYGKKIG